MKPLERTRLVMNPFAGRVRYREGFPIVPGGLPVIGHLISASNAQLSLMRFAREHYGDFFWLGDSERTTLVVLHKDAFSIFRNKQTTSEYMKVAVKDLLGSSLIVHDGPVHQHMRTALNGPFTPKGLSATEIAPVFADMIEARVNSWLERGEINILSETRELVLSLMFRMVGIGDNDLGRWTRNYSRLMWTAVNLPLEFPGSPKWFGRRARRWIDAKLADLVADVRRDAKGREFLAALVNAKDDEGKALSEQELLDNLRLLILAGHETSATVMAWMVAVLAVRPDVWASLVDEAGRHDVPRSPKELRNVPYAEAVFRETLRLHPPVATDARLTKSDMEIGGRTVLADRMVSINLLHLSRHEDLYDRPDDFVPERWTSKREPVGPLELAQFGGGPHFCLGYHVAWLEIVQFAVTLARVMRAKGIAPSLVGGFPEPRYLPLMHPASGTRVRFSRS